MAAIMADPATGRAALQYGSTQGLASLREKVLDLVCSADGVAPSDIGLSPDEVVLTTGSQQLLYLLGEVLFDPGDIVITEAPSYFVYHSLLQSKGVRVFTVPMDDGGMEMPALEALLSRLERSGELAKVKLIYTVDYFQNPDGPHAGGGTPARARGTGTPLQQAPPDRDSRRRGLSRVALLGPRHSEREAVRRTERTRGVHFDVLEVAVAGVEVGVCIDAWRSRRAAAALEGEPRFRFDQPRAAHHRPHHGVRRIRPTCSGTPRAFIARSAT